MKPLELFRFLNNDITHKYAIALISNDCLLVPYSHGDYVIGNPNCKNFHVIEGVANEIQSLINTCEKAHEKKDTAYIKLYDRDLEFKTYH